MSGEGLVVLRDGTVPIGISEIEAAVYLTTEKSGAAKLDADRAEAAADRAEQYDGPWLDNVAALLADTTLTYGPGAAHVQAGDIVRTRAEGFPYMVAVPGSTDHLVATAGGVKLYVKPSADGAYHTAALGAPSGTNDTDKLAALLALASKGKIVFDYHIAGYDTNTLIPGDDTHIVVQPGTVIRGIAGGSRIFQLQRKNLLVEGYGAKLQRHTGQTSHVVYINASVTNHAKRVIFRGFEVVGNGSFGTGGTGENDCIYIGGSPQGVNGDPALDAIPENVIIEDCICVSPRRNCISIVAGKDVFVRNNHLDGTGAVVLRCGVDVEANTYLSDGSSAVKNIWVEKNVVRNCAGINLACVFGDDVNFVENDVELSVAGATGIGGGAGGAQFNPSVFRNGDRLGVVAFDNATGTITVRGPGQATLHDLGIHTGMWVQGLVRSGSVAAWPGGLASPYRYAIAWISPDGRQIRLSTAYRFGEIASFTADYTGNIGEDPLTSDLSFYVYRPGQCSNVRIRRNKIRYVGLASSVVEAIWPSTFYNWTVEDNEIDMGVSTGNCIRATYGYGLKSARNRGKGGVQMLSTTVSEISSVDDTAISTTLRAFNTTGCVMLRGSKAIRCSGTLLQAVGASNSLIDGFTADQQGVASSVGIFVNGGSSFLVANCDLTGAGTTNANSIQVGGSTSDYRVVNCRQRDGTYR